MSQIVVIDNYDSFVYNLVDAIAATGHLFTVVRNTTPVAEIQALKPDLLVLSPGPSHPSDAGTMTDLIAAELGTTPMLGICLGFQALIEHCGGVVAPCGPVHGRMDYMTLTEAGAHSALFAGLSIQPDPDHSAGAGDTVPVARYHSLGCVDVPESIESLGTCPSEKGEVIMAGVIHGENNRTDALGLQFHPESILSPAGPHIIQRAIELLLP
ncbi:Anthranilate synthase component 2 [Corynebacterium ciconiae DSM 44920]|uniref:glutamine amidotransferase-related protein n=1 Tax=Corynebacterium ciconiae TaxID=227319 RepID=UPI0003815780|nr:gamma-glutamyl-gamma-aminobutyrate hydrolase family protein [Corynebacterium ciconiae]WKD62273.1 Anthranilate synthase component 2 [Corynebacterium ciconiae DSM 44920]